MLYFVLLNFPSYTLLQSSEMHLKHNKIYHGISLFIVLSNEKQNGSKCSDTFEIKTYTHINIQTNIEILQLKLLKW